MLFGFNRLFLISSFVFLSYNTTLANLPAGSLLTVEEVKLLSAYNAILDKELYSRVAPAKEFYQSFREVLSLENSFHFPFDTLTGIGKIYSPDGNMRIYSWNIPVGIDDNMYFGVIQFYSRRDKTFKLVFLDELINSGEEKFKRKWDEALYYEIIETKHAGQKYYTLLGFDLASPMSNKKVIDIVSIDDFDELYFCKNLFFYNGKRQNRIVFEYNQRLVMNLRYDEEKKLIIFDHLSPAKPSLEGKFEFYGPDMTYDALTWEKGIWVHLSNIDITN